MSDNDFHEISKMWLPDELQGVVKISAYTNNAGVVSLQFDDDYDICISKKSLINFKSLLNEVLDAVQDIEKLNAFQKQQEKIKPIHHPNNVLPFKKDKND